MIAVFLVLAVLLLVLTAGFFSGSETAFTSTSKAFIHDRAEKGDRRALLIQDMLARTERFLGTTLMGTNLAVVSSTTLCQLLVARYLLHTPSFERFAAWAHAPWNWESLINTIIMAPLILVFGELIPKSLGRAHAERFSLFLIRPLYLAGWCLVPLVWGIQKVAALFCRMTVGTEVSGLTPRVTRDDLRALAELATEQGLVPEAAGSMLQTVFDLDRRPVSTMMIPLVDVASVPIEATVRDVEELSIRTGYARFPVYLERIDEIVGLVSLRGLLYRRQDQRGQPIRPDTPISQFVHRHVVFIPESKPVGELLHELRYQKMPMAVVVDEHGGVVGILTMEDLVEQIVGEIHDERDQAPLELCQIAETVYECSGKMDVRELGERLGLDIDHDGFETAAGLVLKLAGKIPEEHDRFVYRNYDIEVLKVEKRRIDRIRFSRQGLAQ